METRNPGGNGGQTVVGTFEARVRADEAVNALKGIGVAADQVRVVEVSRPVRTLLGGYPSASSSAAIRTSVAACVGGIAGWMLSLLSFVIPGISQIVAPTPMVPVLLGFVIGAIIGGVIGAFTKPNYPQFTAAIPEGAGRAFQVSVTVRDPEQANRACAIFSRLGGA